MKRMAPKTKGHAYSAKLPRYDVTNKTIVFLRPSIGSPRGRQKNVGAVIMSKRSLRTFHSIRFFVLIGIATLALTLSVSGQSERTVITLGSFVEDTSIVHCCMTHLKTPQYTVPTGKRLVIEQIFFQLETAGAASAQGFIEVTTTTTAPSYSVNRQFYPLQLANQGLTYGGEAIIGTSQMMKFYVANPLNLSVSKTVKVRFIARVHGHGYTSGNDNAISGYLETL